ncbi:MAG: hypothetical protein GC162_09705 [Planctomycetes bacterium]|nr:hypothetical protein [Planctomycetota bacterium]
MRWWVFAIFAYLLLGIEVSVSDVLSIPTKFGPVVPHFMLILAVFVGLAAPTGVVLASSLIIGGLIDLTTTWPLPGDHGLTLLGPHALAYLVGGYVLLQVRPMLFREHPLTVAAMMLVAGVAVELIVVAVFTIRAWYEPLAGWSATSELVIRAIGLFYSAFVGFILAIPLCRLTPLFGFTSIKPPGARARRW